MTKRIFDISIVIIGMIFLIIPICILCLIIKLTSPGPILYWSRRVGKNNIEFMMPKFRSMKVDAPVVATHLLNNPNDWLTSIGSFIRKTSLDELPQLWSILIGDMSIVGPRPALYNQIDLITIRTNLGIHVLMPGLTGWAQINGRDEIALDDKILLDLEYLNKRSLLFDLRIIWITLKKVVYKEGILH